MLFKPAERQYSAGGLKHLWYVFAGTQAIPCHRTVIILCWVWVPIQGWLYVAPSQWETLLQSNAVSHWLGANLESARDWYLGEGFCDIDWVEEMLSLSLWQWARDSMVTSIRVVQRHINNSPIGHVSTLGSQAGPGRVCKYITMTS